MSLEIFDGRALNSRTITDEFRERRGMTKKIYTELVQIRKELQTIRKLLEPKTVYIKGKPDAFIIQTEYKGEL